MMWWWHTLFSLSLTHDFPRNFTGNGCQKLSVKPLACSLWLHMSFKHCDVGLDRKWSSSFLRATRSERRSKIMQINGEKGGEIGVERRKRMTVDVLLCFELLFQWNGNSWLVGCLSICQWQKHLSPKRVQFSLPAPTFIAHTWRWKVSFNLFAGL